MLEANFSREPSCIREGVSKKAVDWQHCNSFRIFSPQDAAASVSADLALEKHGHDFRTGFQRRFWGTTIFGTATSASAKTTTGTATTHSSIVTVTASHETPGRAGPREEQGKFLQKSQ